MNLYIPKHSEKITITEYKADTAEMRDVLPGEYSKKAIKVKKNEFDYITISTVRGEKITDTVKIYLIE